MKIDKKISFVALNLSTHNICFKVLNDVFLYVYNRYFNVFPVTDIGMYKIQYSLSELADVAIHKTQFLAPTYSCGFLD